MKRRTVLTTPLIAAAAIAGFSRSLTAQEQALKPLDLSHPTAKALHYAEDAANADPAAYDSKSGQQCSKCQHFKGGNQARGGCALFPGYSVAAEGWCSGWVKAS